MTFIPSPYQQALFAHVADPRRGSATVVAVAGSGKTTSALKCLEHLPARLSVQFFAFNTTIAAELKERIAAMEAEAEPGRYRQVRASTFHSVGFNAVAKKLGKRPADLKTESAKCRKLFKNMVGEADYETYHAFVTKLVGLAKGEGLGVLRPGLPDEPWHELIRHHDLSLESEDATLERAVVLARDLLRESNRVAKEEGWLDYDDQLYLPLLWKCRLWQNDVVFIDEAQDTNPVRRAIAKLALRPGGRLIAIGDPRQAIYGFTGASHDAMDLLAKEFNCTELPLTVSYRCAKSVVRLAQELVPYLEAHEDAPEGEVLYLPLWPDTRSPQTGREGALDRLTDHDAVLCRNTAPLVQLAYELIARGRGCRLIGKDIGEGLANLVKQMRARDVDRLLVKLQAYEEREVAAFTAKGEEQKAEGVTDRVACVLTVVKHLPETQRTIAGLLTKLETLFSDTNGTLSLLTAHKAKGKEYDTVAILRPELMPSKWARQDWQYEQERNLMYVAYTRAKRTLIFVES